jgi:hypothetical protein
MMRAVALPAKRVVALVLGVAGLAGTATADPMLSAITDRNFNIDLYEGTPLGNSAAVATGGATAANAYGSSGTLVNPSAPAVRPTTDNDRWSWDYHFDFLIGSLSTDYANTGIDYTAMGIPAADTKTRAFTFGYALRIGNYGGAITSSIRNTRIVDAVAALPGGGTAEVYAETIRLKTAFARWFEDIDTSIGIAAATAIFDVKPDCSGDGCQTLFSIKGGGLEAGATVIPRMQDFRIGASYATGIIGTEVTDDNCPDPLNCDGFVLPQDVVSPYRATIGGAYRFGPTKWNQMIHEKWRDEESVLALLDLVVTGPSPNAYGLDAFGINKLERSGVHTSLSVRAGAEYEWLPGRLRVRGGTYWEPGRFTGVSGRIHGTLGIELRVFQFWLFGTRRGRITVTGDLAEGYRNLGFSIGFWH